MIELHEFLMLLKSQHKEAQSRIKELVEAPIMVLRADQSKQYLPPTKVRACCVCCMYVILVVGVGVLEVCVLRAEFCRHNTPQ